MNVGHEVCGTELLLLVLGYHLHPGQQALLQVVHVVGEVTRRLAGGVDDGVVDAEVGVVRADLRQVDGLPGGIGLGLCLGGCAGVHLGAYLLGELRDELMDDVVLRVDEVRLELRPVGHHLVAHQVQQVPLVVRSACYLDGAPGLQCPAGGLIDAVGYGAYGQCGLHHDVLYGAYVDVAVGAHQSRTAAGRDVLDRRHGVVEGTLAPEVVSHVDAGLHAAFHLEGLIRGGTHAEGCGHDAEGGGQSDSHCAADGEAGVERHVHGVVIAQRGALGQRGTRRAAGRVAQHVDKQRCLEAQDVLCPCGLQHVEHVALERLSLVVCAVHLERHGHGLQGVVARQQVGLLGDLHHVGALS